MAMTPEDAAMIGRLLRREGGGRVTQHPRDRGGLTKWGVTKAALSSWRGYAVADAEVVDLTEAEARDLYHQMYLLPFEVVRDEELRELLFDCAVLHGTGRAAKWLQAALNDQRRPTSALLVVDGILGPKTLAALEPADDADLYRQVLAARLQFVGRVITDHPSQAVFAAGWLNRIATFV